MKKKIIAALMAVAMVAGTFATTAFAEGTIEVPEGVDASEYHLAICIHSMDNEYWAQEAAGAQLAAEAYGVESEVLTCDSDDNTQLQGIKDFIAQYGDKACFVVDPSSTANTVNIAEVCEDAGCYVTILAHRAEGLYPSDYSYFVASLMLDDMANGEATAEALFEAIGGEGQIAELQGLLGDDSAANRHAAFEAAIENYPDIEVVDSQAADWSQSEAMTLVENWIVNYPDLKAVYSSNDTMALGAIEAIKNAGKEGEILVVGCDGIEAALDAVKDGSMTATVANDGYCIAGYGAAYAIQAALGMLDPASLDNADRMIFCNTTFVDASNVEEIYEKFIETGDPGYDYSDLSFCFSHYQEEE